MGVVREDVVKMGFDIDFAELTKLTSALDDVKDTLTGGIGDDAFDEMVKESKKATAGIEDVKDSIKGIKPDGIDDVAKGLKDTDKEGGDANKQLKKIASTSFHKTVSGLKNIVSTLGKVGLAAGKLLAKGIAAGVVGVAALVGKAVNNYADYEQLTGGVETLFGTGGQSLKEYAAAAGKSVLGAQKEYNSLIFAQNTVMKNAKGAYKTAGLSANDYMSTVTSFSASLIQSLGGDTQKAAKYAHTAIVDMSDNANKMGSDMSSIQDAYSGFAKQNYTMLDNLKLGYGGTKEEMERLLKDASKISGIKYDISSYADVVQAIHVIQEEMGIAGTTSKEASDTISGSFSSMKAAWDNTLTSLIVGGDDFDNCVDNLIESVKTYGRNIMPAITKALSGVGSLIEELSPVIEKELPGIIDTLLPPLIKAATSLLKGIIIALPDIISTLIDEIPTVLAEVWSAMKEAFGNIPGIDKAEAFFGKIGKWFTEHADTIKKLVPAVLGLVIAFKLFNKIKGLTGLFGGGKGGAGGTGLFGSLAKTKPTVILKGMANFAIILGGLAILAAALMWVAPYMAQLSDLKSIAEVLLVIGAVGLIGTGLTKLAGSVGMIPVATVAKGLANIAIIMVGLGVLGAVLMWAAPYVMDLGSIETMFKMLIVIGAVGLVGSALAGLAGLIGMIPIVTVLSGLINIALALAGFTAVVAAFGALSAIDGFNDFIANGGETLALICGIIGEMAGSIVGGFAEGVTDSLADIGTNLSDFATNVKPMFDTFAAVDATALSDFAIAFAAFIAAIAGEKLVSAITGGIDYAALGTNLSDFATNVSGFFTSISTIPEGGFEKATALFDCLAGISSMPKEGGVVGWFEGEVDYSKMATGLTQLASAADFFTAIEAIPEAAFTNATNLFNCLAGVSSLPKEGGIMSWFTGDIAYDSLVSGLQSLTSESMITALTALSELPEGAFTGLSNLFSTLAGVTALPKEGGIFGWFTGDSTTGLTNVTSQLPTVATDISTFFTNLGGVTDFNLITDLFDTLGSIKLDTDVAEGTGLFGAGASQLESMGTGLSNFATNASTFFTKINELNVENMKTFFAELSTVGDLPETLTSIDSTFGTTLSNIVTTVETGMNDAKMAIEKGLTACCEAFSGKVENFYSSGAAIMQGLNNGMASKRGALIATANSIASAISRTIDKAMDINSPSKVTIGKGKFIAGGLAVGMEQTIPDIKDVALKMSDASLPYSGRYHPESDGGIVYNNGGNSDYTSIAPQFNLTISGTQDDRAMARKVKRFVSEAIKETFESMERKNHVLREV